jgi:hypothetical protein
MSKFSVDYSGLDNVVHKKVYKLSEVKDRLEKVAFDIVRFKDSDKGADLWQVQSADDGEYIVALYQSDEDGKKEASWEVTASTLGTLNISYKGEPVIKLAASTLGLSADQAKSAPSYLPEKLATNKKLVNALLKELSLSSKQELLRKYPELA